MIGLAAVFLLIGLAAALFSSASKEQPVTVAGAAQPDVVAKVRAGNLGPVGAIIGAVMKATKGQADAGRVRALVVERIGADG